MQTDTFEDQNWGGGLPVGTKLSFITQDARGKGQELYQDLCWTPTRQCCTTRAILDGCEYWMNCWGTMEITQLIKSLRNIAWSSKVSVYIQVCHLLFLTIKIQSQHSETNKKWSMCFRSVVKNWLRAKCRGFGFFLGMSIFDSSKMPSFPITFWEFSLLSTGHKTILCDNINAKIGLCCWEKLSSRSKNACSYAWNVKKHTKNHWFFGRKFDEIRSTLEEKCKRTYWTPLTRAYNFH